MAAATLMDPGAMKRLLAQSKEGTVNCALGMGPDALIGLLLLDKVKPPKALEREVMKAEPAAHNVRFGTAVVDADIDAKLVRFHVNRAAPGVARRLVKTLKGTGFVRVEIVLEDEGTVERAGEAEEDAFLPSPAPPPPAPPLPPAAAQPAAPGGPGPSGTPDAGALRRALAALIRQVQAADPARHHALSALASQAGAQLKAMDLAGAAHALAALRDALGSGAAPGRQPGPAAPAADAAPLAALSPVKLAKAALLWRGVWAKADRDLEALHDAVVAAVHEDDEIEPEEYAGIEANLRRVTTLTQRLNLALADELDALRNADGAAVAVPLQTVRSRLDAYSAYLEADEMIGLLADNEFLPIPVKSEMLGALHAIRAACA